MAAGRQRALRGAAPPASPAVAVDTRAQPLVLITDDERLYEPDYHAQAFGFPFAQPCRTRGGDWRSGPEGYGLTKQQWRDRTIIVACPIYMTDGDRDIWARFKARLHVLTGRKVEVGGSSDSVIVRQAATEPADGRPLREAYGSNELGYQFATTAWLIAGTVADITQRFERLLAEPDALTPLDLAAMTAAIDQLAYGSRADDADWESYNDRLVALRPARYEDR